MSLGSENGLSVADIAAVTDRNNNGNCGGWGGGFGEMLIAMIKNIDKICMPATFC